MMVAFRFMTPSLCGFDNPVNRRLRIVKRIDDLETGQAAVYSGLLWLARVFFLFEKVERAIDQHR